MILHYNIYPDRSGLYGNGRVQFYLADCNPTFVINAGLIIHERLDKSIGECNFAEWDFHTDQGQIRIDISVGALIELVDEAMMLLRNELIEHYNQSMVRVFTAFRDNKTTDKQLKLF